MLQILARILVSNLTPRSLVRLGGLLIEAGQAAEARYQRIEAAVTAVATLTEK